MNPSRPGWLAAAFLSSFLAVGLPHWQIPYAQVSLPSTLLQPGLLLVVLAAFLLRSRGAATSWQVTALLGAAVPAAVLARVIVDGLEDPTSHNLWPFEVVIALFVGLPCALFGALAGNLTSKLARKQARGSRS